MELVVPRPDRRRGRSTTRPRARRPRLHAPSAAPASARCDFFVRDDGEVLVNEINTIPGFTETSVFAQALRGDRRRLPGPLSTAWSQLAVERHELERALPVLGATELRLVELSTL